MQDIEFIIDRAKVCVNSQSLKQWLETQNTNYTLDAAIVELKLEEIKKYFTRLPNEYQKNIYEMLKNLVEYIDSGHFGSYGSKIKSWLDYIEQIDISTLHTKREYGWQAKEKTKNYLINKGYAANEILEEYKVGGYRADLAILLEGRIVAIIEIKQSKQSSNRLIEVVKKQFLSLEEDSRYSKIEKYLILHDDEDNNASPSFFKFDNTGVKQLDAFPDKTDLLKLIEDFSILNILPNMEEIQSDLSTVLDRLDKCILTLNQHPNIKKIINDMRPFYGVEYLMSYDITLNNIKLMQMLYLCIQKQQAEVLALNKKYMPIDNIKEVIESIESIIKHIENTDSVASLSNFYTIVDKFVYYIFDNATNSDFGFNDSIAKAVSSFIIENKIANFMSLAINFNTSIKIENLEQVALNIEAQGIGAAANAGISTVHTIKKMFEEGKKEYDILSVIYLCAFIFSIIVGILLIYCTQYAFFTELMFEKELNSIFILPRVTIGFLYITAIYFFLTQYRTNRHLAESMKHRMKLATIFESIYDMQFSPDEQKTHEIKTIFYTKLSEALSNTHDTGYVKETDKNSLNFSMPKLENK